MCAADSRAGAWGEDARADDAGSVVDVIVVGAGVVGTAIATECVRSGRSVRLVDPDPGTGATYAAAGMLSPVGEFEPSEPATLPLLIEAARRYPAFVDAQPGGAAACGYERHATLLVGVDAADRARLSALLASPAAAPLRAERMAVHAARRVEPLLAPGIACAYTAPDDHRVDPRAFTSALRAALPAGTVIRRAVRALRRGRTGAACGVVLDDGTALEAAEVVLATGLDMTGLLPSGIVPSGTIRPVHGDILRLRAAGRGAVAQTIRASVRGRSVYLVPRADGGLVVGATQREDGDDDVSAGGVLSLLRDAAEVVPAIEDHRFVEAVARARPATPDHLPLVGRIDDGLVVASGTYRNGVLLAPLIAALVRDELDGARAHPFAALLDPGRFARGRFARGSFSPARVSRERRASVPLPLEGAPA
ncbi:glycine oxidase ThiO [Microbacterium gilvum]|uniref:glycine oxidase n=1 Tax=Microbacterium gilvum TaxID=1336204 RepID=A0ABP9A2B2_9MICO